MKSLTSSEDKQVVYEWGRRHSCDNECIWIKIIIIIIIVLDVLFRIDKLEPQMIHKASVHLHLWIHHRWPMTVDGSSTERISVWCDYRTFFLEQRWLRFFISGYLQVLGPILFRSASIFFDLLQISYSKYWFIRISLLMDMFVLSLLLLLTSFSYILFNTIFSNES